MIKKINATHLHGEDNIRTCKVTLPSTVYTLKRIIIATDVYENYVSNYYDDCHVQSYNLKLIFFKQRLDELDHPALITEWISNMDEDANIK